MNYSSRGPLDQGEDRSRSIVGANRIEPLVCRADYGSAGIQVAQPAADKALGMCVCGYQLGNSNYQVVACGQHDLLCLIFLLAIL
jgi:hypothetical protein